MQISVFNFNSAFLYCKKWHYLHKKPLRSRQTPQPFQSLPFSLRSPPLATYSEPFSEWLCFSWNLRNRVHGDSPAASREDIRVLTFWQSIRTLAGILFECMYVLNPAEFILNNLIFFLPYWNYHSQETQHWDFRLGRWGAMLRLTCGAFHGRPDRPLSWNIQKPIW